MAKKITFEYLEYNILLLIILFIPFTFVSELSFLGELKHDLSTRFVLIGSTIFLLKCMLTGKIPFIKHQSFYILCLFICWIIISFVINFPEILSNHYKEKWGLIRFITQNIVLTVNGLLFTTYAYTTIKKQRFSSYFFLLRRIITYVFFFTCFYSLIEYLYGLRGVEFFKPILTFLNEITFRPKGLGSNAWRLNRITSICEEPPFLAMYLVFVGPWMSSYILTNKKVIKYIPIMLVLLLTYLSGSRTALLIISFQFTYFCVIGYNLTLFKPRIRIMIHIFSLLMVLFMISFGEKIGSELSKKISSLDITQKSEHDVSNQTRWGTQVAAIEVFKKNPYFGVGMGQQGYHLIHHYPQWSITNNWEIRDKHLNPEVKSWIPGYNLHTRLLAELGLVGAITFALFNIFILILLYRKIKFVDNHNKVIIITIYISLIGFNINSLQFDSFRLIGYWFNIAFAIACIKYLKNEQNSSTTNSL